MTGPESGFIIYTVRKKICTKNCMKYVPLGNGHFHRVVNIRSNRFVCNYRLGCLCPFQVELEGCRLVILLLPEVVALCRGEPSRVNGSHVLK